MELSQNEKLTLVKYALNVLDGWGASNLQTEAILEISPEQHARLKVTPATVPIGPSTLERVHLVVEIDGLLRSAFESSHFINNFINVRNNAKNLNGYAPIEHIERGDLTALKRLKQYAKEMVRNAEREQDDY
ncbi:hypothetical protein [Vibrio barjaei]|jgi:hypothetical protein|uniref:Antitoxin Xre/MbcA/ParS-like toxin-binding domain-containing protein n=1 Tax=Vibrio barjaei TaxID=1676683 RepID=A0ABW7ILN3_9VIBR|nr:hypothetical protein [Vibrio barjaei]MCG9788374.1 hypothetical protein [Vibrio mediterranei]MCY9870732.1 hypothetical protein [Vibrio barjaei]OIN29007.1 hypothetical protein AWH66_2007210 [Vibrio barjaei]